MMNEVVQNNVSATWHPPPSADAGVAPPLADFEALLRSVLRPAFGAALRLTANRHDAEDLVQDAALLCFRSFGTFRPGTNFKAWFFRILMNCFYSRHRRRRSECSMHDLEDAHELYLYARTAEVGLHGPSTDPAKLAIGQIASEDIAKALESLPEEYRTVCTLYFVEDFAYQEIADVLGIPVGTVRSRLHRGRRMLQKRLWQLAEDQGIIPARGLRAHKRIT